MPPIISKSDVEILLRETEAAAWRLRRKLNLPRADLDDLSHDLLVDLLRRLPSFDPKRGSLGAFAGIITRNQASRMAIRHARQRRAQGGPLLSLDAPAPGHASGRKSETLGECLSEADGLSAWLGQSIGDVTSFERSFDCARAIAKLPTRDIHLCCALAFCPFHDLPSAGFGSRATLYRRLKNLRASLTAHGLKAA